MLLPVVREVQASKAGTSATNIVYNVDLLNPDPAA
jgi:hypothetical protein